MKNFCFIFLLFFYFPALSQSPGLSVRLYMDSVKTGGLKFKIDMKFCSPVNRTKSGSYFTNEISPIDFKKLTEKDISCGKYISNYSDDHPSYKYYFSNQVFAWEKIIIWKIVAASRDWKDPMYIILPVKMKSFVTFIEVKDIGFEPGKFIWIDEEGKIAEDKYQRLSFSLKGRTGIETDICSLKKVLD